MKLKSPIFKSKIVVPNGDGTVKLYHHQTIRLSASYNSAEASYGAEMTVQDSPENIEEGFKRIEGIVEDRLLGKTQEHQNLLNALAKKRNE